MDVRDMNLRRGIEIDLAVKARHEPVVLVLQVGGVGPADHRRHQRVLPALEMGSQVKLGGQSRILRKTKGHAIEPDIKDALGPTEVDDHATLSPRRGDAKCSAVDSRRIVIRHLRRIASKRHLDIGVVGAVISLAGPVPRNGNLIPVRVVEVDLRKSVGGRFGSLAQAETPLSLERHPIGGMFPIARIGGVGIAEGNQGAPGDQSARTHAFRIGPALLLKSHSQQIPLRFEIIEQAETVCKAAPLSPARGFMIFWDTLGATYDRPFRR